MKEAEAHLCCATLYCSILRLFVLEVIALGAVALEVSRSEPNTMNNDTT